MKDNDLYERLKKKLKSKQSPKRYDHSVSVSEWAGKLGDVYGWDPKYARLAGLLHDYAKEWSPKKLYKYAKKHRLDIPNIDFIVETAPNMLHAYVSSDVVRRKKWLRRKKDLRAIASHTLGRQKMTIEEKILYIADLSARGRPYPEAQHIRKKALVDLNGAFRDAIAFKTTWQLKKGKPIHPLPIKVWNRVVCGMKS